MTAEADAFFDQATLTGWTGRFTRGMVAEPGTVINTRCSVVRIETLRMYPQPFPD